MTSRRHAMISIKIILAIAYLGTAVASPSQLKGVGLRLPWRTNPSSPTSTRPPSSSSLSTSSPRGGAAAAAKKRPAMKGSNPSSYSSLKKGPMKKKMKKKMVRKMSTAGVPKLSEGKKSPPKRGASAKAALTGEAMPSIFRIPSEEKYDRYAAALAVTEGLRRVRDGEIARAAEATKKKSWLGGGATAADDNNGKSKKTAKGKGKPSPDTLEAAKKRAESAFILQTTKAVKALGMTVTQFNQIGREVVSDPALKERVSEQAYLYRMASAVELDKVPLLDDPSSRRLLESTEHKRYRVQLFARSVHEIEDLRADQMESLRRSLRVERFPPGFDLSDPNVQPLLHPEVRRVCERFPVQAEEIVKRYGLDSDEFNRMLEETKGNPIFRWRVQKYVEKAEEERAKETKA